MHDWLSNPSCRKRCRTVCIQLCHGIGASTPCRLVYSLYLDKIFLPVHVEEMLQLLIPLLEVSLSLIMNETGGRAQTTRHFSLYIVSSDHARHSTEKASCAFQAWYSASLTVASAMETSARPKVQRLGRNGTLQSPTTDRKRVNKTSEENHSHVVDTTGNGASIGPHSRRPHLPHRSVIQNH